MRAPRCGACCRSLATDSFRCYAEAEPEAGPAHQEGLANGEAHHVEGGKRAPRAQKTPIQKESLEAAFNSERHCFRCACSCSGCSCAPCRSFMLPSVVEKPFSSMHVAAVNPLPTEEVRRALGDRLDLTAHQVQVWLRILSVALAMLMIAS